MVDILLLNLNWRKAKLNDRIDNLSPLNPLELMYISSGLDKLGIKNELIDLWSSNIKIKDIKSQIHSAKIIIITTAQSYFYWREGINLDFPKKNIKLIRKYNEIANIIIIGPQGTVKPDVFFEDDINYIIRGEPDIAAPKLVLNIIKNNKKYIPGVCVKEGNRWRYENSFANVNSLSNLPLLKYDKLKVDSYYYPKKPSNYQPKNVAIYEASRGCPNDCTFCFRVNFRDKFRKKPIKKIKRELKILNNCNIDYIYLIDENFGLDKKWFELVCSELRRHKIKWCCQISPELLNKKIIKTMANSGCLAVEIGFESSDRKILRVLKKRNPDLNKFKENILFIIRENIKPTILCIIGSPYETKTTIKRTLEYIISFPLDKINVYAKSIIPYPSTNLWKLVLKRNRGLKEFKSIDYNINKNMNNYTIKNHCVKFNNIIWNKQIKQSIKKIGNNFLLNHIRAYKYKLLIYLPWLNEVIEKWIYRSKKIMRI